MFARLIVAVFLLSTVSAAQDRLSAPEVLRKVQARYSGIPSASASFSQRVTLRFGNKEQRQSGTVKIKKGNKYRVETPGQTLIADGKTVWIVSSANNQVLIDAFKENNRIFSPEKFLQGLPDDFMVTEMKNERGIVILSMVPDSAAATTGLLRTMTAWIRENDWAVVRIVYTDRNRTQYDITLNDIRFDVPVNDAEFSFQPPAGMQVVDLRRGR